MDPQGGCGQRKRIFRNEASLVEIHVDRSGLARLQLPEAQLRCRLAQFLCNLLLHFMVWGVQRDRQSHSEHVVDLHHNRVPIFCLSCAGLLEAKRTNTFKKLCGYRLQLEDKFLNLLTFYVVIL